MKGFVSALLILLSVVVLCPCADAQKTTRKGLKTDKPLKKSSTVTDVATFADTIDFPGDMLALYGYEKPLGSNKESLHLRNNNEDAGLKGVIMEIGYYDYRGEELHRREVVVDCAVPSGGTRLVHFPSWDVQKRFYYAGGPRPRNEGYPYTVEIKVLKGIFLYPENEIKQ